MKGFYGCVHIAFPRK